MDLFGNTLGMLRITRAYSLDRVSLANEEWYYLRLDQPDNRRAEYQAHVRLVND